MSIGTILEIIRNPANGMRHKRPTLIDIHKTDHAWLQINGCAQWSMVGWLRDNEYTWKQIPDDEVKNNKKDIIAFAAEPKERYWRGIIEWSSCFGEHEWWKHDDIMEWFPHFDRFTIRYADMMDAVEIKHLIKVDDNLTDKWETFCNEHGLKYDLDLPHIRPRYRRVKWVKKVYNFVHPKFQKMVEASPELSQRLDEYLAPDYVYYEKAK